MLDLPLGVPLDHFPVQAHFGILAQVADHVPVNGGNVRASGGLVGIPQSQVQRASDFFVEQDVFGELLNAEIGAKGKLSDPSGTVVDL